MLEGYTTIGPASHAAGLTVEQLRKLAKRGAVPYELLGRTRMFRVADLGRIRAAGIEAGYVAATEGTAHAVAR